MDVLQDTLIGLAEIAIALAGFSAIVVMPRRIDHVLTKRAAVCTTLQSTSEERNDA